MAFPSRLLFTIVLSSICLLAVDASQLALLQPVAQHRRKDNKPPRNAEQRNQPFQDVVFQQDGNANWTVLLEVVTIRRKERVLTTIVRPDSSSIITAWNVSEPWRDKQSKRWRMNLSMLFRGAVGVTNFSVIVQTENRFFLYVADFQITVAGVSVMLGKRAISGGSKQALGLGPYHAWLQVTQFALPVLAMGASGQFLPLSAGTNVSLELVQGRGPSRSQVDSVIFDHRVCSHATGIDVYPLGLQDDDPPNTLFVADAESYSLGNAVLPDECGLALSKDGRWIVLRLEAYKVSAYAFGFVIRVDNSTSSELMPDRLTTHLVFDREQVPPPLVHNTSITLDAFGGEVLRVPLSNVLTPPQPRQLNVTDYVLQLTSEDGNESKSVQAHWLRRLETIGNDTRGGQEVRFRTPEWTQQAGRELLPAVNYTRRQSPTSLPKPQYSLPHSSSTPPNSSFAVTAPGNIFSVQLASARLAQAESCALESNRYEMNRFVFVELHVGYYTASNFSEHKKNQMCEEMRHYFPGVRRDGVRFVSVNNGIIQYAVSILKGEDEDSLKGHIKTLKQAITDHSFSESLLLGYKDVRARNISVVKQSLCNAFPNLAVGSFELSGLDVRLIPVWVVVGFACVLIISMLTLRFAKLLEDDRNGSSGGYDLETPPHVSDFGYDADEIREEEESIGGSERFPESSVSSSTPRRPRGSAEGNDQDLIRPIPMYLRDDTRRHNILFGIGSQDETSDISETASSSTTSFAARGCIVGVIGGVRMGMVKAVNRLRKEEIIDMSIPQQARPRALIEEEYIDASTSAQTGASAT